MHEHHCLLTGVLVDNSPVTMDDIPMVADDFTTTYLQISGTYLLIPIHAEYFIFLNRNLCRLQQIQKEH